MKELPVELRIALEDMLTKWASINPAQISGPTLGEMRQAAVQLKLAIEAAYREQACVRRVQPKVRGKAARKARKRAKWCSPTSTPPTTF